jgi:frataxin-like iron-binding protein CyaY
MSVPLRAERSAAPLLHLNKEQHMKAQTVIEALIRDLRSTQRAVDDKRRENEIVRRQRKGNQLTLTFEDGTKVVVSYAAE